MFGRPVRSEAIEDRDSVRTRQINRVAERQPEWFLDIAIRYLDLNT